MEENNLSEKELETVEKLVKKLFTSLEIEGSINVELAEETLSITLETEDTGIVIGYHGEALEALQIILGVMVAKKTGKYFRVSVDVGGYKKNRSDYLERLAEQTKARALEQNRDQELSNLKSWERRVVHMFLQNDPEVESESAGEGKNRVLIVRPKAE